MRDDTPPELSLAVTRWFWCALTAARKKYKNTASPDYLGPSELKRGATAIGSGKPDPRLPPERILGEVGPRRFDC